MSENRSKLLLTSPSVVSRGRVVDLVRRDRGMEAQGAKRHQEAEKKKKEAVVLCRRGRLVAEILLR